MFDHIVAERTLVDITILLAKGRSAVLSIASDTLTAMAARLETRVSTSRPDNTD